MRSTAPAVGGDNDRRLTMVLWFVGTSWFAVWIVFRDARFPFGAVAIGALLPDVIGLVVGRAAPSHSAVVIALLMLVAMIATTGRRPIRRTLLATTIGAFLHLAADFSAGDASTFWWPASGIALPDKPIPTLERSLLVNLALEAVGVLLIAWVTAQRRAAPSPE